MYSVSSRRRVPKAPHVQGQGGSSRSDVVYMPSQFPGLCHGNQEVHTMASRVRTCVGRDCMGRCISGCHKKILFQRRCRMHNVDCN